MIGKVAAIWIRDVAEHWLAGGIAAVVLGTFTLLTVQMALDQQPASLLMDVSIGLHFVVLGGVVFWGRRLFVLDKLDDSHRFTGSLPWPTAGIALSRFALGHLLITLSTLTLVVLTSALCFWQELVGVAEVVRLGFWLVSWATLWWGVSVAAAHAGPARWVLWVMIGIFAIESDFPVPFHGPRAAPGDEPFWISVLQCWGIGGAMAAAGLWLGSLRDGAVVRGLYERSGWGHTLALAVATVLAVGLELTDTTEHQAEPIESSRAPELAAALNEALLPLADPEDHPNVWVLGPDSADDTKPRIVSEPGALDVVLRLPSGSDLGTAKRITAIAWMESLSEGKRNNRGGMLLDGVALALVGETNPALAATALPELSPSDFHSYPALRARLGEEVAQAVAAEAGQLALENRVPRELVEELVDEEFDASGIADAWWARMQALPAPPALPEAEFLGIRRQEGGTVVVDLITRAPDDAELLWVGVDPLHTLPFAPTLHDEAGGDLHVEPATKNVIFTTVPSDRAVALAVRYTTEVGQLQTPWQVLEP